MKRGWIVAALTAIACLRIASTYTVFSQTADEPAHVAAGMELLVQHRYTLHIDNTPLPRLLFVLPVWLRGTEYQPTGDIVVQGNSVLYSGGHYRTNLVLVRLPNLLFFILGVLAVWLWARALLGEQPAVIAVLLFTTQPVILGHAGLATTDMAATATIGLALFACWRLLEAPSVGRALLAGAAYGLAVDCKLSSIMFVPAGAVAMLVARVILSRAAGEGSVPLRRYASALLPFLGATAIVCWAGYGFTVGTMSAVMPVAGNPAWASWTIPAPHLFRGAIKLLDANRAGIPAYLFGRSSMHGWWFYFPATLTLKTAIATLIAAVIGFRGRALVAGAAALGLLAWAMTANMNHGIRHILPIFVPLSIVAANGIRLMWERRRWLAGAAVAWQLVAGVVAHPDYFVYFNELAIGDDSRYLLDSNLDWGQDLLRLERELKRRNVPALQLKYFGSADLARHHLPPWTEAISDKPAKGWVAISEMWYRGVWYDGYHDDRYPWLKKEQPVARIGKSIRLYDIR
ncbi:MAG TPA: glycosyltransferase family 39 protein [Thermoanaerobaculia bacterium]|nr:glycosyltransferase family 39 protein [Thermoanaerobaculia bacterium]